MEGIIVPDAEVLAFSTDGLLPQVFEADADQAADRRFEKSEAAARLVVIARQISEQDDLLDTLAAEEKGLPGERAALAGAWEALWAGISVVPLNTDVMIEWLRTRADILGLMARLSTAERNTATWQAREADARRLVQVEFDALGIPSSPLAT